MYFGTPLINSLQLVSKICPEQTNRQDFQFFSERTDSGRFLQGK